MSDALKKGAEAIDKGAEAVDEGAQAVEKGAQAVTDTNMTARVVGAGAFLYGIAAGGGEAVVHQTLKGISFVVRLFGGRSGSGGGS